LHGCKPAVYIIAGPASLKNPRWDTLFETASAQEGLFSTAQAAEAGYSRQLLRKHLYAGRVRRVQRGVYRIVHFPPGEHEDLAAVWLWSKREGVFSHETALALHGLSDVMPARAHVTVPVEWKARRLRVPRGIVPHYQTVKPQERRWVGSLPVTDPARTLLDCAMARVAPDLVAQAARQARSRGLLSAEDIAEVARAAGVTGEGW
jgi:predicted transcriptional regulator of viral defense system